MRHSDSLYRWHEMTTDLDRTREQFKAEFRCFGYVTAATDRLLQEKLAWVQAALIIDDIIKGRKS